MTLARPTSLSNELTDAAIQLLRKHYTWNRPLRSVGVCAMNLVPACEHVQLSLFDNEAQRLRRESIERTMDHIRGRFGHHSIDFALMGLDKKLGMLDAKGNHTIHPMGYRY